MNMNDSQNSEALFDDSNVSCGSPQSHDLLSYKSYVSNVREALSFGGQELQKSTFSKYFTKLLQDCAVCINQSLELILSILSNKDSIHSVADYLNDAVCILQQLSDFIKTVIESVTLSCSDMDSFPTTTAVIIESVFRHCKESETLYGDNIKNVERELKELFRNCHELQLTYLMILEKHFIFDLTEKQEKNILIQALEINLKIGELVQSLDVKTMAEQWKGYTLICEKYIPYIKDTSVLENCSQILCSIIRNNINNSVDKKQNDKLMLRSLKVASFTIKILVKITNLLKQTLDRDYQHVLDLIFFIYNNFIICMENEERQTNLPQLMHANVMLPTQILIKELLFDEKFVIKIFQWPENVTASVFITISVIKCVLNGNKEYSTVTKNKLLRFVYSYFEHTQFWIEQHKKYKLEPCQSESHTLLDMLAIHMTMLALSMNNEEFNNLERCLIQNILGVDCLSAMFSCKLWILLSRHMTQQLLFNQLVWLCTMYKKLEKSNMFNISPQKVHLSHTIGGLFGNLETDEKLKICKQFRIQDDDNINLWIALKVNNLPVDVKNATEDAVTEKMKNYFRDFVDDKMDIDVLINVINLVATCILTNSRGLETFVIKAWMKLCPKQSLKINNIDSSTIWFYNYVESLANLTEKIIYRIKDKNSLIKLSHIITSLIELGNEDLQLILINVLCKLSTIDNTQTDLYQKCFKKLSKESEVIRNKLKQNKIILEDSVEEDLLESSIKYIHKCYKKCLVQDIVKVNSENFDFDIDSVFDENIEPITKKVKLNTNEAEIIITRLETDSSLLCTKEITVEQKMRIKNVCVMLNKLI